jgi:hypothetical protein
MPDQDKASATLTTAPEVPKVTLTTQPPALDGVEVLTGPLRVVIPSGVASGINSETFPRVDGEDQPAWGLTPGHTVFTLEGYRLQSTFHEPQIYIYPALEYAELFSGAFESMHRLRNVMYEPDAPVDAGQLPWVPFFNAAQVFFTDYRTISFQNGDGVHFLTEYAQYFAPVNNHELIYHFQGFTDDGEYYIIAIFPITNQYLADTGEPGANIPAGGVQFPDVNDENPDFEGYYASITDLLNGAPTESFTPSIEQLDSLIESIQIES